MTIDSIGKASIIVLTHNNIEYTRGCLESVFAKTSYPDFEVIVVDNASQDGTQAYLQDLSNRHPNLRLVLNSSNQGFAVGNNQGADIAQGDLLVFLNNDTVVTRDWLTGLLAHLQEDSVGMIGPVTNSIGNRCRIPVTYQDIADMEAFARDYTAPRKGDRFEIEMLAFFCAAMRREVFDEIGPLSERFGLGMFEDDDYSERLHRAGYGLYVAEDVFVHHWGSASFSKMDTMQYWGLFRKNLSLFEKKWNKRWLPPLPGPEFTRERLRDDLDTMIYFAETIKNLQATLDTIYTSNGWAFLQFLLRLRRRVIPEASRREILLKGLIQSLRSMNLSPLRAAIRRYRASTAQPGAGEYHLPEEEAEAQPAPLMQRYRWPMVSVIIPVFNQAAMLAEAAASVLESSYPNFELIILDDGSDDEIEPVLERLALNPRVRIYRQPNQKLPRALTHAHQFARGEFITWTSADNRMLPHALQKLVDKLLANPSASMVFADVRVIDQSGNPLRDRTYRPQNVDRDRADFIRLHRETVSLGHEVDNYINACFLYRREPAQALGFKFEDDLRGLEDYDFWLRLQKSGAIVHLGNEEPLYEYRVHRQTMSHELLTQKKEAHQDRLQKLLAYEGRRRKFANRRWRLIRHPSLPAAEWRFIEEAAVALGVELGAAVHPAQPDEKLLQVCSGEARLDAPVYLRSKDNYWELHWASSGSKEAGCLSIWKGITHSPLVTKARDYQADHWQLPSKDNRAFVGVHANLDLLSIDRALLRQTCVNNPAAFFVFIALGGVGKPEYAAELLDGLDNTVYLGARAVEESYPLYANLDAFWIPPFQRQPDQHVCLEIISLAFAAGKPVLIPGELHVSETVPHIYEYDPDFESLDFIKNFELTSETRRLMSAYSTSWTPTGRLEYALKLADTIAQDKYTHRPDFGSTPPKRVSPMLWTLPKMAEDQGLKCCLMVDSLDEGGLERVVSNLTRYLPVEGVSPFILCTHSGGKIADNLASNGHRVFVANGDLLKISEILKRERPNLVNSHLANLRALEVAAYQDLPIIETIHNTYVWLEDEGWQEERKRSRLFTHALSVSELVKRYYLRFNHDMQPNWITLIPNGIDPGRIEFPERSKARKELGVSEDETLFLSLASYDRRKNQVGILTAFEIVNRENPETRLLMAGSVYDNDYYQLLLTYKSKLKSKNNIILDLYRDDINILLAAADALVIDSFFEGWSLAATEALLAGVPLIHSDCGSGRELVGTNSQRGYLISNPAGAPFNLTWEKVVTTSSEIEQRNTLELVEAMSNMIVEKRLWQAKRESIGAQSQEQFRLERMIRDYKYSYLAHARN